MTTVRNDVFKIGDKFATLFGDEVAVGQVAPEFTSAVFGWASVNPLQESKGKVIILSAVPSLDTDVCDRETRRFNQEAAELGDNIVIMVLSMDVPFTLKNWCAAAGIDKVVTLSDHLAGEFGVKYGVLIKEHRVFRRAIFVVDAQDKVVYAAYMPVLGEEPVYAEVIEAAKKALG